MKPIIFILPGNESIGNTLQNQLSCETGDFVLRSFPDGETYLRIVSDVKNKDVILLDTLVDPNEKILPLLLLTATLKEHGARRIGLLAPYLAYMRQDKSFKPGESITTRHFSKLLSDAFDWLITVDPHLHRFVSLDQVYSIPNQAVPSAPLLADWISLHVKDPLIIGPDSESKQWVYEIARLAKAPYAVFTKKRLGDRDVSLKMSDVSSYRDCTPVLVDDIISTGTTMSNTVALLNDKFAGKPICLGIHGIFIDNAYQDLLQAGAQTIVTTNSIPHSSNQIDITPLLVPAIKSLLALQKAADV